MTAETHSYMSTSSQLQLLATLKEVIKLKELTETVTKNGRYSDPIVEEFYCYLVKCIANRDMHIMLRDAERFASEESNE